MDQHSIERIRSATSRTPCADTTAARSTSSSASSPTGSSAAARTKPPSSRQAELERIGEQTAGILTEAHDAAEAIRDDAAEDARKQLVDTNMPPRSCAPRADDVRPEGARGRGVATPGSSASEADAYVERRARRSRRRSSGCARRPSPRPTSPPRPHERDASGSSAEAQQPQADIEAVISDLEQRRDAVLGELTGSRAGSRHGDPARARPRAQERRGRGRPQRGGHRGRSAGRDESG